LIAVIGFGVSEMSELLKYNNVTFNENELISISSFPLVNDKNYRIIRNFNYYCNNSNNFSTLEGYFIFLIAKKF
jgi:alkyl hydroperoxide reductase subunit AhpC